MKDFEITIVERNGKGEAVCYADGTPKTKTFSSDSAYKIWEFWQRNGKKSERRWRGKKTKEKSAEKILAEINKVFTEEVKQKRRRTFDDGESA